MIVRLVLIINDLAFLLEIENLGKSTLYFTRKTTSAFSRQKHL